MFMPLVFFWGGGYVHTQLFSHDYTEFSHAIFLNSTSPIHINFTQISCQNAFYALLDSSIVFVSSLFVRAQTSSCTDRTGDRTSQRCYARKKCKWRRQTDKLSQTTTIITIKITYSTVILHCIYCPLSVFTLSLSP